MADEPKTRTIEFTQSRSRMRITIDAADRITYGSITPGASKGTGGGVALRVYEGNSKDHLRAVFSDVSDFRDLDIPIKRLAVRKYGTETWHVDDGRYTGKLEETVQRDWVDENEIKDGPVPGDDEELDDALAPRSLGYPTAPNYPVRKR
jgi:hypothetical protein